MDKIKDYLKDADTILIRDALMYEIHSHWFAPHVSNPFLQKLLAKYFAWKVSRKYRRYMKSMRMRKIVLN